MWVRRRSSGLHPQWFVVRSSEKERENRSQWDTMSERKREKSHERERTRARVRGRPSWCCPPLLAPLCLRQSWCFPMPSCDKCCQLANCRASVSEEADSPGVSSVESSVQRASRRYKRHTNTDSTSENPQGSEHPKCKGPSWIELRQQAATASSRQRPRRKSLTAACSV